MTRVLPLLFFAAIASAQTAPSFEVASVKPAQQSGGGRGGRGMGMGMPFGRPGNIRVAPGQLTMRGVTFRTCVRWAYGVPDFQVTGPDWIDQQRYDVVAKAAGDAGEDQMRLMMQTLLVERFKLTAQRVSKESQAWVLTVAKGGLKVKESTAEGEAEIQPDLQKMQVGVRRTSVPDLVELLSQMLRAPVIDETGLKGRYDATIDMGKYMADASAGTDMLSMILTGIQQELGLKLESKKLALDFVVVERAERMPVEN